MRTMRSSGALVRLALVGAAAVAPAAAAQQRDPYGATLHFGTGLINIPVAWVSPNNADVWLQTSGKTITYAPGLNFSSRWNTNISLDTHWFGRLSVGASAYSQNPEWGFFAQALLLRQGDLPFLPSVAVGVRNLGKYDHEERFLIGHDIALEGDQYEEEIAVIAENFDTAPTLYAVATQAFALGSASASLSVGYGNGLFKDDGDLGDNYNKGGTIAEGLFLGGRAVFHPSLNTTLTLLAENDAWDWNAGLLFDWRGISLGVYGTELEEGGKDRDECPDPLLCEVYNYAKLNVSVGYSGNLVDISRGVILRTRITDLEREAQRLRAEVASRERRIQGLETALRQAQAGELAEIERRRQQLETQIQEEREAIRRATERLEQLERGQRPPPATPPATNPPAASPSPDAKP
jgi:hypothetical protein